MPCCWPTTARSSPGDLAGRRIGAIEELEETAKLHLLLQGLKTRTLSDFQVREIEEAFPS